MANVTFGSKATGLLRKLGPGVITACVVIGPGSILTSSKIGASFQFEVVWVLLIAVALMMAFMTMGARLGVVADATPGELLRRRFGWGLPLILGAGVFAISSSYQYGNNLGVASAFDTYLPIESRAWRAVVLIGLLVVFNGLALTFLFAMKDLYRWLERLMTVFVLLMLVAFVINLGLAQPSGTQLVRGLIPNDRPLEASWDERILMIGWIGTTFITAVAYFQAYLVRQKGWTRKDLRSGLFDARVGTVLLALITLMIMSTSATMLAGRSLPDVKAVADQLSNLSSGWGQLIFCAGLFCAAYSSFLVNSMIGGYLLADGLKLNVERRDTWPRVFAAAVLVIGMIVGSISIAFDLKPVPAIVFAQAVTVLIAPLIGLVLWHLTSRRDVMGKDTIGWAGHVAAACGVLMLLVLSASLVYGLVKMATAPVETPPVETVPDETAPDETAPDETAPDETAPDETPPVGASSADASPAGALPVGALPVDERRPRFRRCPTAAVVAGVRFPYDARPIPARFLQRADRQPRRWAPPSLRGAVLGAVLPLRVSQ